MRYRHKIETDKMNYKEILEGAIYLVNKCNDVRDTIEICNTYFSKSICESNKEYFNEVYDLVDRMETLILKVKEIKSDCEFIAIINELRKCIDIYSNEEYNDYIEAYIN